MCASDVPGFGMAKGLAVTSSVFTIIFGILSLLPPWADPGAIAQKLICIIGCILVSAAGCKIGCCSGSFNAANPKAINLGTYKKLAVAGAFLILVAALMALGFAPTLASIREDIDDQECTVLSTCWASPADNCNALQNCDCFNTQADCNDEKGTTCELQTGTYYRWCNTNDDNDWEFCSDESYFYIGECQDAKDAAVAFTGLLFIILIVWGIALLLITGCSCGLGFALKQTEAGLAKAPAETAAPVQATVVQAQVVEATLATPSDV